MRLALNFPIQGIGEALARQHPELELIPLEREAPTPADLQAEVLLTPLQGVADVRELLTHCQGLKWVHIFGTGADGFPFDAAQGLQVTCSRGANAVPIAEWVLAMMLAHEKQLPQRWLSAPPEQWFMADLGSLAGKTLGLVGFGSIAQAIARRALAFDMRVVAKVRRHRDSPMPGVTLLSDLDSVLGQADHLVLALPATPDTAGLMDAEHLRQIKSGCHLVNIARANLIDQEALHPLLDSGHIACASLDVVEPEPLPEGHWLYSHPRVRLSPHISWSAPGVFDSMLQTFLDNLAAYRQQRPLQGMVDLEAGY